MPPRIVSSSEHIKASLSAGVYTNKHGEAHVYLVRVCFLFGQIRRAPLLPFAVESDRQERFNHFAVYGSRGALTFKIESELVTTYVLAERAPNNMEKQ